jgi:hypothetical protein
VIFRAVAKGKSSRNNVGVGIASAVKTYPLFLPQEFWHGAQQMFLRSTTRKKDGKQHRYFSVVENRRLSSGKTAQRTVRRLLLFL